MLSCQILKIFIPKTQSEKVPGKTKGQAAMRDLPFPFTNTLTADATAEQKRKRSYLFQWITSDTASKKGSSSHKR